MLHFQLICSVVLTLRTLPVIPWTLHPAALCSSIAPVTQMRTLPKTYGMTHDIDSNAAVNIQYILSQPHALPCCAAGCRWAGLDQLDAA
jgi:hypothetical protein